MGSETVARAAGTGTLNPVLLTVAGFALLAAASYGLATYDLLRALLAEGLAYTLVDRDFANYWVAGQLVVTGEYLDLFSQNLYFPRLQALFGVDYQIRNWGYPPHFLLFLWPLGFVGYKAGFVVFLAGTFALFALGVFVFKRELAPRADARVLLLAVFGYVLLNLVAAQNGFLTAAALLLGLALMKRRPILAGVAFACLTIKPQLGLLIPVLLAFDRNWAAFLWSAVFTAVLVLLSAFLFGLESWSLYLTETLAYQRFVMTDWYGIFLRMMPTVFGSVRTLGFSPSVAAQAQWPVSVAAAAVVLWLLYRERDGLRRAFMVTCGTFLITPYALNYDMGALSVCAALLATEWANGPRRVSAVPIAMVAAFSAAVMNLGRAGMPLTPLVLAIGLGVLAVAAREGSAAPSAAAPASAPT